MLLNQLDRICPFLRPLNKDPEESHMGDGSLKSWDCTFKSNGSSGIRTHAPDESGALNQRLRPLGHVTFITNYEKNSALCCAGGQIPPPKPAPTSWNLHHNTTVWTLDSPHLPLHKITYWPMILMALCIIDFIGANALLGPVGGMLTKVQWFWNVG